MRWNRKARTNRIFALMPHICQDCGCGIWLEYIIRKELDQHLLGFTYHYFCAQQCGKVL